MDRFLCLGLILSVAATACAQSGVRPGSSKFSDEAVDRAIKKAVAYLWSQQRQDGSWPPYGTAADKTGLHWPLGPTALGACALLESGADPVNEPGMAKALKWLASRETVTTYTLGLRAHVWLLANRKAKGKYTDRLRADVVQLYKSSGRGSYDYWSRADGKSDQTRWDNSNSAYGALGVWAGALGGVEVPVDYWHRVLMHWVRTQQGDGGWSYHIGRSSGTMTTGGIVTVALACDALFASAYERCGQTEQLATMAKGLRWLDRNFAKTLTSPELMGPGRLGYYLHSVERVGRVSGRRRFGKTDWFKAGASLLLDSQEPSGAWAGRAPRCVPTAFGVLFLVRGRRPALLHRLKYPGDWNNRPTALAHLARWMGREFGRHVGWRVVDVDAPLAELSEAPVLVISGAKAPAFTPAHVDKLRRYIDGGGTIFSVTECAGSGFGKGIRQLYARLFPKLELVTCGPKHKIYTKNVLFDLTPVPEFHAIVCGTRPVVVHTDVDLPLAWQTWRIVTRRTWFQAAANVVAYTRGRHLLKG